MIKNKKSFFLFKVNESWGANEPSISKIFSFCINFQSKSKKKYFGYIRKPSYTKIIDLNQDMLLIFSSFNSTTRNEIKKAEKIGMIFNVKKNISLFVEFYNNFAKIKKLALLDIKKMEPMGNITEITYVTMENGSAHVEPLVMHLYLV